jgi:hypothetical protein
MVMQRTGVLFQLPLSGSLEQMGFVVVRMAASNFQLPLSGSRPLLIDLLERRKRRKLSTPSLGITRFEVSRSNWTW